MFKKGRRWREVGGRSKRYLLPRNIKSYRWLNPWREVAGGPLSYAWKNTIEDRGSSNIYRVRAKNLLLPPARGVTY